MTVTVTSGVFVKTGYGYATYSVKSVPYAAGGSISDEVVCGQFDKWTVQITGTFGTSGSIQVETSNDGGTTWVIDGMAITAAGFVRTNAPLGGLVRLSVTAGDGTTSLNGFFTFIAPRA